MTSENAKRRLISGALQGAVIGLLYVVFRAVRKVWQGGLPNLIGENLFETVAFSAASLLGCVYVFAVGSAIAGGILGSLIGTISITAMGIAVGSHFGLAVWTAPYPIILTAVSVLVGPLLGAMVQRRLSPPAEDGSYPGEGIEYRLGPARTYTGPEFLEMLDRQSGDAGLGAHNLYVEIPEPLTPNERLRKYERPLADALDAADIGEIAGGGTQLTDEHEIEHVGIDVTTTDLNEAIDLIAATLRSLDASRGTVIRYGDGESVDIWGD